MPNSKRLRLFDLQSGTCAFCEKQCLWDAPSSHPDHFTIEHIIPLCYGGPNAMINLCGCCRACNVSRERAMRSTEPKTFLAERFLEMARINGERTFTPPWATRSTHPWRPTPSPNGEQDAVAANLDYAVDGTKLIQPRYKSCQATDCSKKITKLRRGTQPVYCSKTCQRRTARHRKRDRRSGTATPIWAASPKSDGVRIHPEDSDRSTEADASVRRTPDCV
jgi:hypothetical protein